MANEKKTDLPGKPTGSTVRRRTISRQTNPSNVSERLSSLFWLTHPLTFFVLATVATVGTAGLLWEEFHPSFANNSQFALSSQNIALTPPNAWINEDPKFGLLETLESKNLTLLDWKLIPVVVGHLENLPYIDEIHDVRKSATGLIISAVYRSPVAWVQLIDGTSQLVDRRGVVMGPAETINEYRSDFLRINLLAASSNGTAEWAPFPDERVHDLAAVCHELKLHAKELLLYQVISYWAPNTKSNDQTTIEVWTSGGGRIIWSDVESEMAVVPAIQKVAAIKNWIALNGPLEKLAGWRMMDVRTGEVLLVPETRAALERDGFVKPF